MHNELLADRLLQRTHAFAHRRALGSYRAPHRVVAAHRAQAELDVALAQRVRVSGERFLARVKLVEIGLEVVQTLGLEGVELGEQLVVEGLELELDLLALEFDLRLDALEVVVQIVALVEAGRVGQLLREAIEGALGRVVLVAVFHLEHDADQAVGRELFAVALLVNLVTEVAANGHARRHRHRHHRVVFDAGAVDVIIGSSSSSSRNKHVFDVLGAHAIAARQEARVLVDTVDTPGKLAHEDVP